MENNNFPDLFLVTEHWLKYDESIYLQNYSVISNFSRKCSIHGGTMIFIKNDFSKKSDFINFNKFDHLLVEKEFEFSIIFSRQNNLFIICLYRPPLANIKSFFINLEILLSGLPHLSSCILTGDFNINYLANSNQDSFNLKNLLHSFNLTMNIDFPTRFSQYSHSTIDYICSNIVISCRKIDSSLSDHEAIYCEFNCKTKTNNSKKSKGRIYSKNNYNKFQNLISSNNWYNIVHMTDPLEAFHSEVLKLFEEAFPVKTLKKKSKNDWITKGIKISSKNMRSLHYIRKYTAIDSPFIAYFNKYRNIYRKIIKIAKKDYYENRISMSSNPKKECWSIINNLRGKNNILPINTKLSSESLNSFYCSVASNLSKDIICNINPLSYMENIVISETFFFTPTNIEEILCTFNEIKNKSSSGWDNLSIKIFSKLSNSALEVLVDAINFSFLNGEFPKCLKASIVIPIYKGGDYDTPSNFRPISLLPTLSKIIEKIIKNRMISFIQKHKILNLKQFGFQKNKNTSDAIFSFLEYLYTSLNEGDFAAAIFCDLSKAFDCVNHSILLQKLQIYGFRGMSLNWFKSYLSERSQIVQLNNIKSESKIINCGVPQGSVLGPLLFLLYINDLAFVDIKGQFTMFADDTTILWNNKNKNFLYDSINNDILKIKSWCDSNLLTFNINKTNILTFKCELNNIHMNDEIVKYSSCTKFLGLIVDVKLNFKDHIEKLCNKLASNCYAIRILSRELEEFSVLKSIYYSLIDSNIRYGICFWGNSYQYLLNKVFVLQKRAIRCICKAKTKDSCKPLFKSKKILTLTSIYILETVCLMFKKFCLNSNYNSLYDTRKKSQLQLPNPNSTLTKKSLIYDSKKIYNHLPSYIKKLKNLKKFKLSVKNLLLSKAYYVLTEYFDDNFN